MLIRLALRLALLLAAQALLSAPARALPVDTALVFAVDVSASVDEDSWQLQRNGLADAVESVRFMNAVTQGMIGRTAIAVMQWSSDAFVAIDWRVVASRADARRLALEIRVMPRLQSAQTCVAKAISAATTLLTPWTEDATRRVIDISGDGKDGCGASGTPNDGAIRWVRHVATGLDITINGLPIINDEKDVAEWYAKHVIGGPGAFLEVANSNDDFAAAMRRKLVQEIAAR